MPAFRLGASMAFAMLRLVSGTSICAAAQAETAAPFGALTNPHTGTGMSHSADAAFSFAPRC
jgi:hypothetical protein